MINTEHRVAIVTGSSQGIGLAIAELFLKNGLRVAFVSLDLDQLNGRFQHEIERNQALLFDMDVTDTVKIRQCMEEVERQWGRCDILVNNAGIRTTTSIENMTMEEWNLVMTVNLSSTFFFSQAAAPLMKQNGWGRIINMSSFGGQVGPTTSSAAYAASKAGQLALTKVFARELAPYGVTVNAVTPASIRTPEMDKMSPDALESMVSTIPLGRFGEMSEVSELVLYLASDSAGFVTGATFDINGGRLMR
jgi:NAD(P)-dependent dehydrogenase (short-subunit alcohol dehydrogenase family)